MGRLEGKVALITGAARGQGAAAARAFIDEGAKVVIADVLDEDGNVLAKELGDAAHFVHLDVSSEDAWTATVAETAERFGALDVLVNNAGILIMKMIEDTTVEDFRRIVDVNQLGVFLGMRSAIPAMRERGGSIVNVSSVEGLRGAPALIAYASTKFAVTGMTKVGAVELGRYGIRVNSIHPGAIDTPMVRAQGLEGMDMDKVFERIPAGRAGRPEDIAGLVVFLASDESSYCTGAEFVIDGGASSYIGWRGPIKGRRPE